MWEYIRNQNSSKKKKKTENLQKNDAAAAPTLFPWQEISRKWGEETLQHQGLSTSDITWRKNKDETGMLQMTDLDQDPDETNGFHYCSKGHCTNFTYQDQFTSYS